MELTKSLRSWLIDNMKVAEAASDEEFQKAVLDALSSGKLTPAKLAELTKPEESPEDRLVASIAGAVTKAMEPLMARLSEPRPEPEKQPVSEVKATELMAATVESKPRVIEAAERYSTAKSAAFYSPDHLHYPNQQAKYAGIPLDHPSRLDLAVSGAWFKHMVCQAAGHMRIPRQWHLTDHDKELVQYALHKMPFTGLMNTSGGPNSGIEDPGAWKVADRLLTDMERKALLDDSTSGGQEAVPTVFDQAIIMTPVLYGELFPLVEVVPVARGHSVNGFSIGNPTFASTAEGTQASAFTTTSMIAAFDNTIYPAIGCIEIGQDFEADSPVDIGGAVVQAYGRKAMEWLDNQIANGDGSTEPTGVFNVSGITDIGNPAGGDGAAPQVDDYETLLFNVSKAYRPAQDRMRTVFLANDTTYSRAMKIKVGSSDARRVFREATASSAEQYMILGHPYKVQNDISNAYAAFVNLAMYRMYRRQGLQVRVETGGKELAQKNLTLIVVRMRFGGSLTLAGAASYSDNFQA